MREVTNNGKLTNAYSIQLRRINLEMHDLCIGRKTRRIAGNAIVQPCAEHQQQIVFVQRHVGCASAMHADHAKVVRRCGLNGTKSVNGGECWNVEIIQQLTELGNGSG